MVIRSLKVLRPQRARALMWRLRGLVSHRVILSRLASSVRGCRRVGTTLQLVHSMFGLSLDPHQEKFTAIVLSEGLRVL